MVPHANLTSCNTLPGLILSVRGDDWGWLFVCVGIGSESSVSPPKRINASTVQIRAWSLIVSELSLRSLPSSYITIFRSLRMHPDRSLVLSSASSWLRYSDFLLRSWRSISMLLTLLKKLSRVLFAALFRTRTRIARAFLLISLNV